MQRLLYGTISLVILLVIGAVSITFIQAKHTQLAQEVSITAAAIPEMVAKLPDIEHIPFYPDALVTKATFTYNGQVRPMGDLTNDSADSFHIVYEISAGSDAVSRFYQDALPKNGWSQNDGNEQVGLYTWTDPTTSIPWRLSLEVVIGLTFDDARTLVNLEYQRYPNLEGGLPVYSDARQVEEAESQPKSTPSQAGNIPVRLIDKTYLTGAKLQDIADFYNQELPAYGWDFFDASGLGEVDQQTGDIRSKEGLFFRATHSGPRLGDIVSYQLHITAVVQENGQVLVKLHVEEQLW